MNKKLILLLWFSCCVHTLYSQWVLDSLPVARPDASGAAFQDKIYFVGGRVYGQNVPFMDGTSEVNVFNCATSGWDSSLSLSSGRYRVACVAGDSAFYAFGGSETPWNIRYGSNVVDVFKNNVLSRTDTIADSLFFGKGVKAGSKVVFAGFADSINYWTSEIFASDKVYIYDEITGIWSTSQLSAPRTMLAAAANDTLAIFAGGVNGFGMVSDAVDIYNTVSGTWTTAALSEARGFAGGTFCNGKFYFAGGTQSGTINYSSDRIDVYDGNSWTIQQLSVPRCAMAMASVNNHVYFMGGGDIDLSLFGFPQTYSVVDVLNTATGAWSTMNMPLNVADGVCGIAGNKIVVGLGRMKRPSDWIAWQTPYVQILDLNLTSVAESAETGLSVSVYPNPASGSLTIRQPDNELFQEVAVFDMLGEAVYRSECQNAISKLTLDVEAWRSGIYSVRVKTQSGVATKRVIIAR